MQGLHAKELIGAFGLGALIPAFFSLAAVRFGGFSVPAALALAAFGFPGGAGALGALVSTALLPALGIKAVLIGGGVLAAAGWKRDERPVDWKVIPAAAAWLCWARLLSLLLGDPLAALALLVAAGAAGFWSAPAAAGAAGALGLAFMRLLGLNAGSAERLQVPAAGWPDALFLGVQLAVAAAVWLAFSGARGRRGPAVAFGALLGAAGMHFLGPAPAALLFHGAQALLGARAVFNALPAGLLGLGLAFFLAWPARRLLHDVWLTRLNAAFPGGKWLALSDDGRAALGRYRFSSGATVTLEDGVARQMTERMGRRIAHALALTHPSPKSALLIARYPGAAEGAAMHSSSLDVFEAFPGDELPATATRRRGDPRRFVRGCKGRYDLALVAPAPHQRVRRLLTREFLGDLKACLTADGVAGFVVATALEPEVPAALLAGSPFANASVVELPGAIVLLLSDGPTRPDLSRLDVITRADDPDLERELMVFEAPPVEGPAPTDDKPFGPSVTTRNWYNPRR